MADAAIITQAGLDELNNAQQAGLVVHLKEFGVGTVNWEPTENATQLKSEFERFPISQWEDTGIGVKRLAGSLINVEDRSVTFANDQIYPIPANGETKITNEVVKSNDETTTYMGGGTDYTLDAVRGTITRNTSGGNIAAGETVKVSYDLWGVPQSEEQHEFQSDEINLNISFPEARKLVITDSSGVTTYQEGVDYDIDLRSYRVDRLSGGNIVAGETVLVSFNYNTPVNEIGVYTDTGTLFSVFSHLGAVSFKSTLIPALPISLRLQLVGTPLENLDVTIGSSPIALNLLEKSITSMQGRILSLNAEIVKLKNELAKSNIYVD
jgi:hypothetical protein